MLLMIENAAGIGFQTLGIGMLIVIGVLALLMLILYLLIPIFRKIGSGGKNKARKSEAPNAAPSPTPAADNNDDEETVAVITAAIAALSGASPSAFKVVSFKRLK